MSKHADSILSGLNPEQEQAVKAEDGPIQVVAGAGTGKTRVLTHRIAWLISTGRATAEEIIAVTFTTKAAREMRERLGHLIGPEQSNATRMGTFHAITGEMLRQHPTKAGLRNRDFLVLDEEDQAKTIAGIAQEMGLFHQTTVRENSAARIETLSRLTKKISYWKGEGLRPKDVRHKSEEKEALELYETYQKILKGRNACDFDDLLLHMTSLMREHEDIRLYWANKFRYVLVDEFQDTNTLQYEWLMLLAKDHRNLFCVGDTDQSIYQWRNARPEIMQHFEQDWPDMRRITLFQNYRSTQEILNVANKIVNKNKRIEPKQLISQKRGQSVEFTSYPNHDAEADGIVEKIQYHIKEGTPHAEICILVRGTSQMEIFEQRLTAASIPVEIVGGKRFFAQEEVKDALAYMRLALDPSDTLAFQRIFNKPERNGIGEMTASYVLDLHRKEAVHRPISETLRIASRATQRLPGKSQQPLLELATTLEQFHSWASDPNLKPGDLIESMLEKVGYISWCLSRGDPKAGQKENTLQIMIDDANRHENIHDYIQNAMITQSLEYDHSTEKVRISTFHGAKGLEWDVVFMPCMEKDIFPNKRSLQEVHGLEEERRIAHVGITRAKKVLETSCALQRHFAPHQPSSFLEEMDLLMEGTIQNLRTSNSPHTKMRIGSWRKRK